MFEPHPDNSHFTRSPQIPLDSLSDEQIRDAVAMLFYLRRGGPIRTFIEGTESWQSVMNLCAADLIQMRSGKWRGLDYWEVLK